MARNELGRRSHSPHHRHQAGFTLVELLMVTALSVMIMLTATAMFMTFLIGNTKTSTAKLVKAEGDFALNQMAFLIRNAIELEPTTDTVTPPGNVIKTCESGMGTLALKSLDGETTILTRATDPSDNRPKIASNSSYLTSGAITLTSGPTFNCTRGSDYTSQYVTITFTLRKGTPGVDQPRDIVEQTFTTGVQIRSL